MTRSTKTDALQSEDDPVVVVFAADDSYAMPLAAAVRSLLDNASPERLYHIFIIDCGISTENRGRLNASWNLRGSRLTWKSAPFERVAHLPVWGHFGYSVYYRLLIGEILPPEVHRAIYLDSDVLVLGDIGPLFDHPLGGLPLGAARDGAVPIIYEGLLDCAELGLQAGDPYFNSGVLLFDLCRWRSERLADDVMECVISKRESIRWPDQDALNSVLRGRWLELEPRWNAFFVYLPPRPPPPSPVAAGLYRKLRAPPEIVHFVALPKPWSSDGWRAARGPFFEYLDRTQWAGWRPPAKIRFRPLPPALGQINPRDSTREDTIARDRRERSRDSRGKLDCPPES